MNGTSIHPVGLSTFSLMNTEPDSNLARSEKPLATATGRPRPGRRFWVGLLVVVVALIGGWAVISQFLRKPIDRTPTQSVQIVSGGEATDQGGVEIPSTAITANLTQELIDAAEHPLDPLIRMARLGLRRIDAEVQDYTAIMQKQVRIDGELAPDAFMRCKVRHARETAYGKVPFSVYTYFLKPERLAGQEAIWVEGANDGKLVAHPEGILNIKRFYLKPTEPLAMQGNLHPITDFGMRNLIAIMIRKGLRDRERGMCDVRIERGVMVDGHQCTLIEVTHPEPKEGLDYHKSRIFIDDVRNLPIAYEGYLWPEQPGEEPPLLEKYYYTDIELNVGLTDEDFDPGNERYNFRAW